MNEKARTICLVTIHGIGFQQPPLRLDGVGSGMDGYADDLHRHLRADNTLNQLLGDDPLRQHAEIGPIYVQNHDPIDRTIAAIGPTRLGTWSRSSKRTIDTAEAPLVSPDEGARIAHIALVYSDLEERTAKVGSSLEATAMSLASLGHYATVGGLIHMLAEDVAAGANDAPFRGISHLVQRMMPGHSTPLPPTPSLRVRTDPGAPTTHRAPYHEDTSGLFSTVRQLENDVAAYVCRNDLRTRVRGFVRDALCRLAYRSDVAAIVVNSHSNGTPIAYDVLHELTPNAITWVRALITAGSPLRKYADLFTWGTEIGNIADIKPITPYERWLNFYDPHDPVADPLMPGPHWRPGQPPEQATPGLFHEGDHAGDPNAKIKPASLQDYPVNNLANSGGVGLRAHNYWDNNKEFVSKLSEVLTTCVEEIGGGLTKAE